MSTNAVNWSALIESLHAAHGMTFNDIAMELGTHRHSVKNYYRQVTSPSHLTGEKLIALWLRTTGKAREELPMARALPTAAQLRRG